MGKQYSTKRASSFKAASKSPSKSKSPAIKTATSAVKSLSLTPEAKELLSSRKGYRTETAYGEGYRNAIPVIRHELYELNNISEKPEIAQRLGLSQHATISQIENTINKKFGNDAKVLWLTTREGVKWYLEEDDNDPDSEADEDDIDEYRIPDDARLIVDSSCS